MKIETTDEVFELDADLESADWTKSTWDLPPYRSADFMAIEPDLEAFRKLPIYAAAVASGLILDDEWVGDYVVEKTRRPKFRKGCGCGVRHTGLLKAAPMPPTKKWVLANEAPVAKAIAAVLRKWAKKVAAQLVMKLPAATKADLRQLLRKDATTDAQIAAILAAIELDGFATDFIDAIRPELEAAFTAGGISGAGLIGFADDKSIVEQIPVEALAWAKDRAAELVGMSYDKATDSYVVNPDSTMSIDDATRSGLRGNVATALAEGWSADDLATAISDNYEFSDARAETIARTELAFAHVQGNLATWDNSGVVGGKRWILADTHPGPDECDDFADEDAIELSAQFGGEIDGPPAHPNCLCALEPILISEMDPGGDLATDPTAKAAGLTAEQFDTLLAKFDAEQPRDEAGRWTTSGGGMHQENQTWVHSSGVAIPAENLARMKALGVPPAWTGVRLNPDPNGALQAIGKDAKGRSQYIYSAEHSQQAAAAKFERLKAFTAALPGIREAVARDLTSSDPKKADAAAVTYLIDKTGFRVGGTGDTQAEKQAYGASTLTGEHVTVSGDHVAFNFTGKKGVDISHEVTDARLAGIIDSRASTGGRLFSSSDSDVRSYLKSISGQEFKVKDFRTYHGTATALAELAKLPAPTSAKEAATSRLTVAKAVAAHLGNTPAVAVASYIDPAVWGKFDAASFAKADSATETDMMADFFATNRFDVPATDWEANTEAAADTDD